MISRQDPARQVENVDVLEYVRRIPVLARILYILENNPEQVTTRSRGVSPRIKLHSLSKLLNQSDSKTKTQLSELRRILETGEEMPATPHQTHPDERGEEMRTEGRLVTPDA